MAEDQKPLNPEDGIDDSPDFGQAEVQAKFDEAEEKGYYGNTPDPTPNENYSLETPQDAPTPETDRKLADEAHAAAYGGRFADWDAPQDVEGARKHAGIEPKKKASKPAEAKKEGGQ